MTHAIDLEPSSLESILLDVGVLAALIATIVIGVLALRRRR